MLYWLFHKLWGAIEGVEMGGYRGWKLEWSSWKNIHKCRLTKLKLMYLWQRKFASSKDFQDEMKQEGKSETEWVDNHNSISD